jgi:hypothetical protein
MACVAAPASLQVCLQLHELHQPSDATYGYCKTDCLLKLLLHGKRKLSKGTVATVDLQNQNMERSSQR